MCIVKKSKKALIIKSLQRKGILIFLLAIVFVVFSGLIRDWIAIGNNFIQKKNLEKEYQELQAKQEVLEQEVTKLQEEDYVLRYAREKYGYSKDGELIIRINEKNEEN